jgi:small GTP-binding protein
MSLDNVEDSIKVIVVGDGNVGKTSMLRRFVKGEFVDQYKKTIGAEFMEKDVYLRELKQTVKLMLWDTAGQEVFNALTSSYYRGAGAAIIAFSTIDRDSFMNVEKWKQKVESRCGEITIILCQTKFDLMTESAISTAEAEALAIKLKLPFFRVSTKDDFNVTQIFEFTAQQSLQAGAGVDGGVDVIHGPAPTTGAKKAPVPAASAPAPASGDSKGDVVKPAPVNMKPEKTKKEKKEKKGFFSKCAML